MKEPLLDEELVERAKAGDKKAFDLLVRKYQHRVVHIVRRYVNDLDESADVAQEVFIKAYRSLPGFRGESAFFTWLYRIAINTAKNYRLALDRRPPSMDVEAELAEQMEMGYRLHDHHTPESEAHKNDIIEVVLAAVDQLPEDLKTAITLREVEGLSYEEIANAMDCPIGTVRSRISRARAAIDARLRPLIHPD